MTLMGICMVNEPSTVKQGQRLREARASAGFATAAAAARTFGWGVAGYVHHENGTRTFSAELAARYAASFGVTEEWLLYGKPGANEESAVVLGVYHRLPNHLKREALIFMRGLLVGSASKSD